MASTPPLSAPIDFGLAARPIAADEISLAGRWGKDDAGVQTQLRYLAQFVGKPGRFDWWLMLDGEPVGSVGLFRHGRLSNWAVSLYVAPQHRGRGLAKRAIASISAAFPKPAAPLLATVRESNAPSIAMFSALAPVFNTDLTAEDNGERLVVFRLDGIQEDHPRVVTELARGFESAIGSLTN